jgi:hypothetical protein
MEQQQWQPNPQAAEQLIALIRAAFAGGSQELQRQAHLVCKYYL